MKSLQTKIFLFFIALLVIVQAMSLLMILTGNKIQETEKIVSRLNTAKTIFNDKFNNQKKYLNAFAETASKDYGIKQVFEEDTRSLLVALNNHRKRIDADLAMAISDEGLVTAQLKTSINDAGIKQVRQGPEHGEPFRYSTWLESQELAHLYLLDKQLYQLSLSPLTIGSKTIGWLAFGFKIDTQFANTFKEITNLETDFLIKDNEKWSLVASSNESATLKFALEVLIDKENTKYISTSSKITEFNEYELGIVMYGLKSDVVAILEQYWLKFIFLVSFTLFLSLVMAYLISASITKPIKHLVRQAKVIASGNYKEKVNIDDKGELGILANEFNTMQLAVLTRENEIKHNASHDDLTNLPNRCALMTYLEKSIKDIPTNSNNYKNSLSINKNTHAINNIAICHLNLCRLKDINETLGHNVGDWLIKTASERLSQISQAIFISHIGSDEFILLFKNIRHDNIEPIHKRIQATFDELCDYNGVKIQLQVRSGIALFPQHASTTKTILQMADTALHHAKKNNHSLQVFDNTLSINSVERLNLINDLKNAINDDQLELHYQPKLNLQTQQPKHVEALVRWIHPVLGMIRPDDFIHIAEQTGQINALTKWVYTTALKQYQQWHKLGLDINIAVNISAENLKSPDFFDFICTVTTEHNVPTHKITLEVTESAVVDNTGTAMEILKRLQQYGMKISIDDYGTGYSSLSQLKQLPVNELKIDKSFVQHLHDDNDDKIIVRSTIALAHNMGLTVVAEGIEDEFALTWLTEQGCELAQGYFISRPKPSQKITQWLLDNQQFKY